MHHILKPIAIIFCLAISPFRAQAQFYVGGKLGLQGATINFEGKEFLPYKVGFVPGFDLGSAINISIGSSFDLYNELAFSIKGASIRTTDTPEIRDRWTLGYIDAPILLRANIFKRPQQNFFLQMGPTISYWYFGNGKTVNSQLFEDGPEQLRYSFRWRETLHYTEGTYVPEANRMQLSLNVGVGSKLKFRNKHLLFIDLRYEMGNTYLSRSEDQDYVNDFEHNFRVNNRVIKLSAAYLMNVEVLRKKFF
jgi:hypothetical protein